MLFLNSEQPKTGQNLKNKSFTLSQRLSHTFHVIKHCSKKTNSSSVVLGKMVALYLLTFLYFVTNSWGCMRAKL